MSSHRDQHSSASTPNAGKKKEKLAEVIITPDHLTTGFLEDAQIIVQLFFDQFFLTLNILVKNGVNMFTHTHVVGDLRETPQNCDKWIVRRVASQVKNTCIAFFSFVVHKIVFNIPRLPHHIKVNVSICPKLIFKI